MADTTKKSTKGALEKDQTEQQAPATSRVDEGDRKVQGSKVLGDNAVHNKGKVCYSERLRRIGHALYEPAPYHFKIPHGLFLIEGTSIATDSEDNVYCFNRGNMPVLVRVLLL